MHELLHLFKGDLKSILENLFKFSEHVFLYEWNSVYSNSEYLYANLGRFFQIDWSLVLSYFCRSGFQVRNFLLIAQ